MNKKEKERWEQIRAKGKLRYILVHGIIGWGVSTAIIYTLVGLIMDKGIGMENISLQKSLIDLAIALVVFPTVGVLQSIFTWNKKEQEYLKE
ncbi:hypothetical protein BX659_10260 [Orenia metallireducens]|jgi:hypothetical protein|uniref:Uncharacterized protein n=1 Tax=Orenia metallireducens TaxID=1413210 RepID=A0A285F2E3_9FIRM|nr:hypothetical protein [Orenia metallireducens]PRX34745.1 hypothetical protein BX659_10260 [Orenia metallireducens]SNY05458.1 hypothetical protein SAMN06265827_10160 [Orenia metallireducens]